MILCLAMKKSILFAIAALSMSVCACDKVGKTDDPVDQPEVAYVAVENAESGYYADYYKSGTNNYYIQLYSGKVDEGGYLTGEAVSISFDLFTSLEDVMSIPEGEYKVSPSLAAFTVETGVDMTWREKLQQEADELSSIFGETVTIQDVMQEWGVTEDMLDQLTYNYGADYYVQDADENYEDRAITDGVFTVSHTAEGYQIKMDFTAGGKEYHYIYEGDLNMKDYSGGSTPEPVDPTGDIAFAGTYAQITNWGESWEGAAASHNTWTILAYEDKIGSTGAFIELDVVTEPSKTLVDGVYPIVAPSAENIKPGVAVGYYEEYNYSFGCWYGNKGYVTHEGNSGSVTIAHESGKLSVSFSFKDTSMNQSVVGTVKEGEIEYFDYSSSSAAPAKSKVRAFAGHKRSSSSKNINIRK